MEHNFGKKGQHSQYGQSVAYNYNSIMHYGKQLSIYLLIYMFMGTINRCVSGSGAFSKNGKPTILKKNMERIHANRQKITEQDLKKIRIMYKCSGES